MADPVLPRCDGCAFTAGTEANESQITRLKSTLCAQIAEPFYCHQNAVDDTLPEGEEMLCRGWAEAVQTLYRKGHYERMPEWRKEVLRAILGAVTAMEDRIEAGESLEDFNVAQEVAALLHAAGFEFGESHA